jgi:hypothetical protein
MPRYFFHLVRDGEVLLDSEGVELRNDTAARRVAKDVIAEFQKRNHAADVEGWVLEIVDTAGRVVETISVSGDN